MWKWLHLQRQTSACWAFPRVSLCIQNLHLTLSFTGGNYSLYLPHFHHYRYLWEKKEPLISQTPAWAACPRGSSQFISWDKGRQARACVATAPGAAGRFDTGGILFPSTGLGSYESVLGVKIGICLGCFTAANATEFHPNCFPCQPRELIVN